jgi:hypothetical protein
MEDQANWKDYAGRRVLVQKAGSTIRTGYVKDVTHAADVLWLESEGVEPRALYEKAQGYVVLPLSEPAI